MKADKKKAASAPAAAAQPEPTAAAPGSATQQADGESDEEEGQEETTGRYIILVSITDNLVNPKRRKRSLRPRRKSLQHRLLQRRKVLIFPHYRNGLQLNRLQRKLGGKLKKKKLLE
jgi:hypothetical protein